MEMTAHDASILSLVKDAPQTKLFDRLVAKLNDPRLREVAEEIRRLGADQAQEKP